MQIRRLECNVVGKSRYDLPLWVFFLIVGQNSGITNDFAFVISGIVFDSKPSMSAQRRMVLVETPYCFAR